VRRRLRPRELPADRGARAGRSTREGIEAMARATLGQPLTRLTRNYRGVSRVEQPKAFRSGI